MSLKRRRNVIGIGIAAVIASAIAVVLIAAPAQLQRPEDLPPLEEKNIKATRAPIDIKVAAADPKVKEVLATAVLNETDFDLRGDQDLVTIMTWGKHDVAGSWREGYKISLTQGKIVEVLVDRDTNKTTSVNISPRPDEQRDWNFTENQKRLISILMNDSRFQQEFSGKTDGEDYYIGVMRDQGVGDKAFITISSPQDNSFLYFAIINQQTEKVEFAGRDFAGGTT